MMQGVDSGGVFDPRWLGNDMAIEVSLVPSYLRFGFDVRTISFFYGLSYSDLYRKSFGGMQR